MLPYTCFDRLSRANGLRTDRSRSERRTATRVPLTGQVLAHSIEHVRAGAAISIRLKDLSAGGVAVMYSERTRLTREFIVALKPHDTETHFLWCHVRRVVQVDGICRIAGCRFVKLLLPGQTITPGTDITRLSWLDVSGNEAVEDPFEAPGSTAEIHIAPDRRAG
jgi:hypothetical protein